MIYKLVPHGIEVIFINIVDGVEVIYEDFFDHQDISSIQSQFLKYN
ncbi:hypothetical protein [Sphingobacterium deserti]|uniref:Uncharacterized protein n=1 Tax=Sphingobacterium deserti TaxID=1229276 RepID=A0A0B8T1K9_9SPHI|nr:hypothetical protein [Sphingobacterium deserti]KGE14571.1 hypothetical protein DI53_1600 [Sphingobacterium deserti]